jgi:histidyl-tRNA synthetase
LDILEMPFTVNHMLVRGLDYYTRTTFEIQTDRLGAQNAVVGGGRYDALSKQLGGPDHPAIGFALGVERLVSLQENPSPQDGLLPDLFLVSLGERAGKKVFKWAHDLRRAGLWIELEYAPKGLKSQMKKADRLGAKKVLIVGEDEMDRGKAILRDMNTKVQEDVNLDDLVSRLKKRL